LVVKHNASWTQTACLMSSGQNEECISLQAGGHRLLHNRSKVVSKLSFSRNVSLARPTKLLLLETAINGETHGLASCCVGSAVVVQQVVQQGSNSDC